MITSSWLAEDPSVSAIWGTYELFQTADTRNCINETGITLAIGKNAAIYRFIDAVDDGRSTTKRVLPATKFPKSWLTSGIFAQNDMEKEKARLFLGEIIARHGITYADVSRLIGRNHAYIQQFIKRGSPRRLDEQDRRVIARHFGVAEHLLSGFPTSQSGRGSISSPTKSVLLPKLSLGTSAGSGTQDGDARLAGAVAIDTRWLMGIGVQPPHASVMRVDGGAMAPTLRHGDDIIVDHSDDMSRLRDGIYVLRLDDVLMVKRVAIGPRRAILSIISDNNLYPRWEDMDVELVNVVGRVAWVGRCLP